MEKERYRQAWRKVRMFIRENPDDADEYLATWNALEQELGRDLMIHLHNAFWWNDTPTYYAWCSEYAAKQINLCIEWPMYYTSMHVPLGFQCPTPLGDLWY